MQIFVEKIENPNQEFWIWKKEITNRQTEGIYPSAISNVGSGISAAIYQKDEAGHVTQIAQLQLPDYEKLVEYYSAGKEINLNYTYIDDFAWTSHGLGMNCLMRWNHFPIRNVKAFPRGAPC